MISTSISAQYLGGTLPRILTMLEESNYVSIEPLMNEFNTSTIEELIELLSNELAKYQSRNFHPMAAMISRCLATVYKFTGNNEKWLQIMMKCLTPHYQKYLPSNTCNFLNDETQEDIITAEIESLDMSPIDIHVGFLTPETNPSSDINISLVLKSVILEPTKLKKMSLQLIHSETGVQNYTIFNEMELLPGRLIKQLLPIPPQIPGKLTIKSAKLIFGNCVLTHPIKARNNLGTIVIDTYQKECKFLLQHNEIGITNFGFNVKAIASQLPPNTNKVTLTANLSATPASAVFHHEDSLTHNKVYEIAPNDDLLQLENSESDKKQRPQFEDSFEIWAGAKCDVRIDVQFIVEFGQESITHEESVTIKFVDAFTPAFKMFGPTRLPMNLKTSPPIQANANYVLLATLEYNLGKRAEITEMVVKGRKEVTMKMLPLDLPLSVGQSEAVTLAATFTAESTFSGSIGAIKTAFILDGVAMEYEANLPSVVLESCEYLVKWSLFDQRTIIGKENVFQIHVKGIDVMQGIAVMGTVSIADSPFYEITSPQKIETDFNAAPELDFEFKFIPRNTGIRMFPPVRLLTDDGIELWQSAPFLEVEASE